MTDSHTTEYIARLREEPLLLALSHKVSVYLERIGDQANRAEIALRQTEHFYYKTDAVYGAMRHLVEVAKTRDITPAGAEGGQENAAPNGAAAANGAAAEGEGEEKFDDLIKLPMPKDFSLPEDCHRLMKALVDTIYVHGDERSKARAVLCHIYHKCIHGDFHSARDALLMSHLQEQACTLLDFSFLLCAVHGARVATGAQHGRERGLTDACGHRCTAWT